MEQNLIVPALAENVHEADVAEVSIKPGDVINAGDIVLTLETDKAAMDLPAEFGGKVTAVRVKPGQKVKEGDVIAVIETAAADAPEADQAPATPAPAEQPATKAESAPEAEPAAAYTKSAPATLQPVPCPELGEGKTADVIELQVKAGDTVAEGDPLLTVETEKAATELPAPFAGTVRELKVKVGDKLKTGDVVAMIETAAGGAPVAAVPAAEPATPPAAPSAASAPLRAPSPATPEPAPAGALPHATPSVRRFARELGVDLSRVPGSGRKGRITQEDVQAYVKAVMQGTAASGGGLAPLPAIDFAQWGEIESVPLSRIRQLTGENLGRSWPQVPQVTQHDEADITELEAFRKAQAKAAEARGAKLTLVALLLKVCAGALKSFPDFNSSLAPDGKALVVKRYIHIGVAVDTPAGLVVPVIRDVDRKGILDLAAELGDLSARARERKLKPDELQGGTFTISSLGGIGGTAFTPIVNWPQVAILGVSRAALKPVWDGSAFAPRLMLPLSLSYDHRVIDGAAGARFTRHLAELLEDLRGLLL
ncbi:dihydrolipoyllysine-residue acetyltransferase [Immundisolibacter sp.]|uniref:dihydrolipoyllysine-residue acetyltransferase n=1 Tax=Immundisolibacter sp. TaxID=1934948 RepID=UPI00262CBD76|nr:dihydrolipoyllysine-residue acetyltransferase [Immundisolibacter sp.]MDD3651878.1 dihydrolipoyllysine-residue acetyltransferase [Immundisolibacter sp.]